jgi:uncharacterized membrane protein
MSFDEFLIVAALVVLGALLLGPIGFFLTLGTRRRLAEVEQKLAALETRAAQPAMSGEAPDAATQAAPPPPIPTGPPPTSEPAQNQADTVAAASQPPEGVSAPAETAPPSPVPLPLSPPPPIVPQVAAAIDPIEPAAPPRSLEETLGTRWAVWIGGIALGLGGLLLVRYSIEQNWFGPAARIFAGFLFALALVVGGEALRRRERRSVEPVPTQIPAVLTAAGTVAAFGTVYAAHALYHFVGPGTAFVALGLLGLATMAAAALHGPALAGLGLVGALVAPLLVKSDAPDPWPVVIYIGFVTASAYGLARLRFWLWLALTAAAGSFLWGLALLNVDLPVSFAAVLFHALLQTLLAVALFVCCRRPTEHEAVADFDWLGFIVPGAFALLMFAALAQSVVVGAFGAAALIMTLAAALILAVIGMLFGEVAALTLVAGALLVAIPTVWPSVPEDSFVIRPPADLWPASNGSVWFGAFALCPVLALAAAMTVRLIRSPTLRTLPATIYAAAGSLTALATLAVAYVRLNMTTGGMVFAALAGGLAFLFLVAAVLLQNRLRARDAATFHLGLGAFAAAALAALSLGLVFALDRGMLTVALALAALGASFVDRRLDVPALRWGVAALGLIIAVRLAIDPRIVGADLGTTPIFNWLLWGYGVPALAFALAAQLMRLRTADVPAHISQALAILFSTFLVFFEIRHAIHGGDPFAPGSTLIEQGLLATASFAYAIAMTRLDAAGSNPVLRAASLGFGLTSFALVLLGLLFFANSLFDRTELEGGPILNSLILGYALPALLAYFLARAAQGVRPTWYLTAAQICLHVLAFVFLNLEMRRLFEGRELWLFGPMLDLRMSDAEFYAYSALWLGLGLGYFAYGILRGSTQARLISGLLIVASIVKVFLFDLASLQGILRALSFIGLGLVLMAVGFVYQKFVFARRAPHA